MCAPISARWAPCPDADRPGVSVTPLHLDDREEVRVDTLAPGAATRYAVPGGAELFVLHGTAAESGDELRPQSWVRVPPGGTVDLKAGAGGASIWVKTGHLSDVRAPG